MKNVSWDRPVTKLFHGELWSILPVSIKGLPDTIEFDGKQLNVKPNNQFHVSLINGNYVSEVVGGNRSDEELTNAFERSYRDVNVAPVSIGPELRSCHFNEKQSIVIMCEVAGLNEVFENLKQQLRVQLERPPTHLTLYDKGKGIALSTQQQLRERSKVVTGSVLKKLKADMNYERVFGA